MDVLKAFNFLKEELLESAKNVRTVSVSNYIINKETDGQIPHGGIIHIFGNSDSGKTNFAYNLINTNIFSTFAYASANLDDVSRFDNNNCLIVNTNSIDDILTLAKESVQFSIDCLIIDNFSLLINKKELNNSFSYNQARYLVIQKFLKELRQIASVKGFFIIILNSKTYDNNAYLEFVVRQCSLIDLELINYSNNINQISYEVKKNLLKRS